MILGLCDRFHKLPSEVLSEDAGILRLLRIEELSGLREQREQAAEGSHG